MMVSFRYPCAIILWVLWLWAPALAQNLVTNGSFETGSFSGWVQTGNTGFTSVTTSESGLTPPQGTRYARMGPLGVGNLYQDLATISGQAYQISYVLHAGFATSATRTFVARWGTSTLESLSNPALFGFTTRTFTINATAATTRLTFSFENSPDYWRLDNVFVSRVVPELSPSGAPVALAFCLGILAILGDRRLSQKLSRASE